MLHDTVAGSGLTIFAEIALVVFFCIFFAVSIGILLRRKGYYDAIARIPLDDQQPTDPSSKSRERGDQ